MIFDMLVSLEFRSLVADKFLIITNELDSFLTLYKIISVTNATQTKLCDLETLIHFIGWRLVLFCWGLIRKGYFQSSPAKTYNIPSIARIVHLQIGLTQKVYDSFNLYDCRLDISEALSEKLQIFRCRRLAPIKNWILMPVHGCWIDFWVFLIYTLNLKRLLFRWCYLLSFKYL